jgi:hypothetical protein
MGQMLVFKPGRLHPEQRTRIEPPPLAELQKLVEGYIEIATRWYDAKGQETQVIVNEEGTLRGLEPNAAGTRWMLDACAANNVEPPVMLTGFLHGPVVVLIGEGAVCD